MSVRLREFVVSFKNTPDKIIRAESLRAAQDKAFERYGPYVVVQVRERRGE